MTPNTKRTAAAWVWRKYCCPATIAGDSERRRSDERGHCKTLGVKYGAMVRNMHGGCSRRRGVDLKAGDFSDAKLVTPYGEIPWNKLSRIRDDEMREFMKQAWTGYIRYCAAGRPRIRRSHGSICAPGDSKMKIAEIEDQPLVRRCPLVDLHRKDQYRRGAHELFVQRLQRRRPQCRSQCLR